jgi:hypothetical protein
MKPCIPAPRPHAPGAACKEVGGRVVVGPRQMELVREES